MMALLGYKHNPSFQAKTADIFCKQFNFSLLAVVSRKLHYSGDDGRYRAIHLQCLVDLLQRLAPS